MNLLIFLIELEEFFGMFWYIIMNIFRQDFGLQSLKEENYSLQIQEIYNLH